MSLRSFDSTNNKQHQRYYNTSNFTRKPFHYNKYATSYTTKASPVIQQNRINKVYFDPKNKQILVDYIYSKLPLHKLNYENLKSKADLESIKSVNYFIMPNYFGYSCLLVFMKNKDRYYSYIVRRNSLVYNKANINLDNVYIIPVEIDFDHKIYNGTIFDGICYMTNNRPKIFIINEVYLFRGDLMFNEIIKYKLMNVQIYLNKFQRESEFKIVISPYYELSDIEIACDEIDKINKKINMSQQLDYSDINNLQIKGFIFYPFISGTKFIYNFTESNDNIISKMIDNRHTISSEIENKQKTNKLSFNYELKKLSETKPIELIFEMKKTSQIDVYKLYVIISNIISSNVNHEIYKTKFISNAYIPTVELSVFWQNAFKDNTSKLVKCKYIHEKHSWLPCAVSNEKLPNTLQDFSKFFNITV